MNANIMNTQIFHLNKYDLKGHRRSQKFNNQVHQILALTQPFLTHSYTIVLHLMQIYGSFRRCYFEGKSEETLLLDIEI